MERRRFLGFIAIGIGAAYVVPHDAARMVMPTGVEMTNGDLLRRFPLEAFSGRLTEAQSERFIDLIVNTSQLLPKARVVKLVSNTGQPLPKARSKVHVMGGN